MEVIKIDDGNLQAVISTLSRSEMMRTFGTELLTQIAQRSQLLQIAPAEILFKEGDPSDYFFMLIQGEVAVISHQEETGEDLELVRLSPPASIGEIGLMLEGPRTATIHTTAETLVLKIDRTIFNYIFDTFPKVGIAICKFLAQRVQALSVKISLPYHDESIGKPPPDILKLLPMEMVIRHRILPLKAEKDTIHLGAVGDPTATAISAVRRLLPSMKLGLVRISQELFDEVLKTSAGLADWHEPEAPEPGEAKKPPVPAAGKSPKLDTLLKRLVGEGASDLHLSAGQAPHWRIDGEITQIGDAKIVEPEEVFELLKPVMNQRALNELDRHRDTDFAYSIPGTARFRVNFFRDDNGFSAAIRVIPSAIFNFDQLGTPPAVVEFCRFSSGMILITGPSGCGKSTTLAAMIDFINKNRNAHIITLEDPVEFVFESDKSLINQREIGNSVESFARGLRAGLREDPDIVLVGELRDFESMSLALETANTGHLVLATLHTSTAVSTINRLIDAFPPDLQKQVRNDLGECLKGVICQRLCKRIGGGRVAAFEALVVTPPIGNMIREDKIIQIPNMMQTGRKEGHVFMNDSLYQLVNGRKVEAEEALKHTTDKDDLKRRLAPM
jgi:twitching motility protein PilT